MSYMDIALMLLERILFSTGIASILIGGCALDSLSLDVPITLIGFGTVLCLLGWLTDWLRKYA